MEETDNETGRVEWTVWLAKGDNREHFAGGYYFTDNHPMAPSSTKQGLMRMKKPKDETG